MSSMRLHTRTQTSSPLSYCSTDDLEVKSGPLLHESLNEVVDITDSRAVDALLQLAGMISSTYLCLRIAIQSKLGA